MMTMVAAWMAGNALLTAPSAGLCVVIGLMPVAALALAVMSWRELSEELRRDV